MPKLLDWCADCMSFFLPHLQVGPDVTGNGIASTMHGDANAMSTHPYKDKHDSSRDNTWLSCTSLHVCLFVERPVRPSDFIAAILLPWDHEIDSGMALNRIDLSTTAQSAFLA